MSKLYYFVFIVNILLAFQNSQKIHFSTKEYDFGKIEAGLVVHHEFIISNKGNAPLKIQKVKASCGCTAVTTGKYTLKPGDTTKVYVEFDTFGLIGEQKKYIYVFSDDVNSKEERLTLKADIIESKGAGENLPRIEVENNRYSFGDVIKGKIVEGKLKFFNKGKKTLVIRDVKSTCSCIAAEVTSKQLEPGESAEVRFDFDTTDRIGKMSRTITLYTNDPSTPYQSFALFINIIEKK